ncbi:hypothetical protein TREMEDRAFT_60595 [Tremella mesenterica DSM 1558]|uniref:uncharacterized protein n=1 Tax=Tremella mesenterica (strain ATCC 24925 / CBS 8224 / DSM 1558 / NBRC 9311 / NRRL Y-6157 / RJB 2259-6 / UBC 559-6) TaxID=578456 RepID=UPI0003F4A2B3|nr:uncharacterized protein TREMEDRAFT_60595 [Tremella mesenterica DSM 1558]EIW71672.1 hypothetical protein TREMEDRAFT_60595 [Tremella mesenterica DSM 1558]
MTSISSIPVGISPTDYNFSTFDLYGPVCIGVILSVFGCGIFCMQVGRYLTDFPNDQLWHKLAVLLALNIAQSASDCSRMVKILVLHPADLIYFLSLHSRPEEIISPSLSVVICAIVQFFFLFRFLQYAKLSVPPAKRGTLRYSAGIWTAATVLAFGVLLTLGAGIGEVVTFSKLPNYLYAYRGISAHSSFARTTVTWLSASAATDIFLSILIIFSLRRADLKNRQKAAGSDMISAMAQLALQSGIMITALQIATLIAYLRSNTAWADFPQIFISKFYSCSLLFALSLPRDLARNRTKTTKAQVASSRNLPIPLSMQRVTNSWKTRDVDGINAAYASQTFGPGTAAVRTSGSSFGNSEIGTETDLVGLDTRNEVGQLGTTGTMGQEPKSLTDTMGVVHFDVDEGYEKEKYGYDPSNRV